MGGGNKKKAVPGSVEVKSYHGILDFFGVMDEESFEYVDFEGVTDSELSLTVDLMRQRLIAFPEVVSELDCFGGNGGDSDGSYNDDEDDGYAAHSRRHHFKGKTRYLYTYVQ